jgi:hypothetical protein
MTKNSRGSNIHREGKPSGNGRESEGLNDAFAGTDPQTENELRSRYINEQTENPDENVEVRHPNRHLHKGEELETFKNSEE